MARVSNVLCDGCGKILLGQDRMAKVSETFISIMGSVSYQLKESAETGNRRDYMFLTESHRDETSFCDLDCLQSWMKLRETINKNRREQALKREVEAKQ